jgi:fimbrial chaperone protein
MSSRPAAAAVLLALLAAPPADAAAPVAVSPTSVILSSGKQTDLVNLTNQGDDPARFQLKVEAWDQRPDGESVLTASDDVVVFPPLLSLAAHETKKVRLATTITAAGAEKSYRLSVQELPSGQPGAAGQVQMLTKLSLPVFVPPEGAHPDPRIDPPVLKAGVLQLGIRNAGTAHFVVRQVRLAGDDGAARRTFELSAPGWYVLPGGRRDYRIELAASDCRKTTNVAIEVETEEKTVKAALPVSGGNCGAASVTRFVSFLAGGTGNSTP